MAKELDYPNYIIADQNGKTECRMQPCFWLQLALAQEVRIMNNIDNPDRFGACPDTSRQSNAW